MHPFRRPAALRALLCSLPVPLLSSLATAQFGPEKPIGTSLVLSQDVVTADIDGDGDQDVFAAAWTGTVAWYANLAPLPFIGLETTMTSTADGARSIAAVDVDADGDPDLLVASALDDTIAWHENTDGLGTFVEHVVDVAADYAHEVAPCDLDGDGDRDILAVALNTGRVQWYENTDGQGTFGPVRLVGSGTGVYDARAGDLDGDGDEDVLVPVFGEDRVVWFENTDGAGNFGPSQLVLGSVASPSVARPVDLDLDGDLDSLSGCWLGNKIVWRRNLDGAATFGPGGLVTAGAGGCTSIVTSDFDTDGDPDVLYSAALDDEAGAYENDGSGGFSFFELLTTSAMSCRAVWAADLTGNGVPDALTASSTDSKLAWYENTGCLTLQQGSEFSVVGLPSNPTALLGGLSGPPSIGDVWDPVVDHRGFLPGASLDVLGIGDGFTSQLIPGIGNLFVNPVGGTFFVQFTGVAGVPFAVAIPNVPCLAGTVVWAQVLSVDGGSVALTNALQLVIGNV